MKLFNDRLSANGDAALAYEKSFIRCKKDSDGWLLEVNDKMGVIGNVYEILHIAFVITIAVQGERVYYDSLAKQNYYFRNIIPVTGTLEELKALVSDPKSTVKLNNSKEETGGNNIEMVNGSAFESPEAHSSMKIKSEIN